MFPAHLPVLFQVGEGGKREQGIVGEGRFARPAGNPDTRGTRRHRRGCVFRCDHVGGAVSRPERR